MRNVEEPAGVSFIFVYGPSGIGKTTMRLRVEQKLIEQALPELELIDVKFQLLVLKLLAQNLTNSTGKMISPIL